MRSARGAGAVLDDSSPQGALTYVAAPQNVPRGRSVGLTIWADQTRPDRKRPFLSRKNRVSSSMSPIIRASSNPVDFRLRIGRQQHGCQVIQNRTLSVVRSRQQADDSGGAIDSSDTQSLVPNNQPNTNPFRFSFRI